MKKIHLLGFALFALLAFGALAASAAFAEEALWLVKNEDVLAPLASETKGEILLIVLKAAITKAETWVLCSGSFVGTVGAAGADEITALLNLALEEISKTPLSGIHLLCTGEKGCEATEDIEVWPDNLPWKSILELMEPEPGKVVFLDLFFGGGTGHEPGYHIANCLFLGIGGEDLCEGPTSSILELVGASLIGRFVPSDQESEKLEANCELAGVEQGLLEGEGTITLVGSTEELDVSSP